VGEVPARSACSAGPAGLPRLPRHALPRPALQLSPPSSAVTRKQALVRPHHYHHHHVLTRQRISHTSLHTSSISRPPQPLSVERAFRAVRRSEVAVLVLDAGEGVTQQDFRLAEYIVSGGGAGRRREVQGGAGWRPAWVVRAVWRRQSVGQHVGFGEVMWVGRHVQGTAVFYHRPPPPNTHIHTHHAAGRRGARVCDRGEQVGHGARQNRQDAGRLRG
jgi:hypothetical protein